jgi:phosphoserine phosphatase RsbU/P
MHRQDDDTLRLRTAKLIELSRNLAMSADLSAILQLVIDALRDLLDAERATVFEYDARTDELFTQVAHGLGGATPQVIRIPAGAGIAGAAAKGARIVNIPDAYADSRFNRAVDQKTGFRTRTILAIPLLDHDGALVGVAQVLNRRTGVFDASDEELATGLAAHAAVAMRRGRLIEDRIERERLERELDVARSIQAETFPTDLPQLPGWDMAAESAPAESCGGDAYDVVTLADGVPTGPGQDADALVLMVADATGHGIASALSAVQMRGMLRVGLRLGSGVVRLAEEINAQLCDDLPDGRFVTAWFARVCARTGACEAWSSGQAPILLYRARTDDFVSYSADAPPCGVFSMPYSPDDAQRFTMEPGDILLALTDGFYEAPAPDGHRMTEDRVKEMVHEKRTGSAREILDHVKRTVHAWSREGPPEDDQTGVILKRIS